MTKPTPGPWSFNAKLSASENHRGFTIRSDAGWVLADVIPVDEGGVEGKANARLIAAAPDLLEAVRGLLDALPSATTHPAIAAARAAIAKATGGEE